MAVGSTDGTAATAFGGKNHCVLPALEEVHDLASKVVERLERL